MTYELISTETAIAEADYHSIYPGAFVNDRKYRPSTKNTHDVLLAVQQYSNWRYRIGGTMKRMGKIYSLTKEFNIPLLMALDI